MRQAFYNSGLSSDGDDAVSRSMVFIGFASMMRGVVVCQQTANKSLVNKSLVVVHESPAGRLFLRLSLELLSGSLSNFLPHSHISINPLLTATSLVHTLEVVLQV